jgi:hypothetical protein
MTRDGRVRNDNVPQRPDIFFNGDINDTAAVRCWILGDILPATKHVQRQVLHG